MSIWGGTEIFTWSFLFLTCVKCLAYKFSRVQKASDRANWLRQLIFYLVKLNNKMGFCYLTTKIFFFITSTLKCKKGNSYLKKLDTLLLKSIYMLRFRNFLIKTKERWPVKFPFTCLFHCLRSNRRRIYGYHSLYLPPHL